MGVHFKSFDRVRGKEIDLLINEWDPGDLEKGWVPAYKYGIVRAGTEQQLGTIDFRVGYQESLYYGGHIGYSVDEAFRGRHFAGKACLLLRQVALAHEMTKIYITCNPENFPSRKTCEYVGAKLREVVDLPKYNDMYQRGERKVCVYEWYLKE